MNGKAFPILDQAARFPAHGSFTTRIDGQLLLVDVLGPWNAELVAHYQKELDAVAARLAAAGRWAVVVQVFSCALFTPDAMGAMQWKAEVQARTLQRAATAFVIAPEIEGAGIIAPALHRVYAPSQPFALLAEVPPALAWARAQLTGSAAPDAAGADASEPQQ